MFGLMEPDAERLSASQKSRHRRYYCGLCHGVGVHVGHGWRGVHSHDAVFLAMLVDGLVDAPAGPSSCRCPIVPVVHRATRDPSSVALRFAVGAQLLLADQWIADKVEEGSRAARFAREVLDRPVGRGRAVLDELGVDLSELDGFERVQAAVEADTNAGPQAAAEPTARALALLFERIAILPGGPSEHAAELAALGAALGELIYLVDALEDLEEDARKNSFNPLLCHGLPDAAKIEDAARRLRHTRRVLRWNAEILPFSQNRDLVQETLESVLARGERALALAREKASGEGRHQLMVWLAQPAWVHAAAALMTAWASMWLALSTTAQAAPEQLRQAGDAVIGWFVPRAQQCPCDKCGDGCKNCGDGCKNCGDGCKGCCDGCNDCGKQCDGCGKDCQGCCQGFNDCMDSCTACLPK